MLQGSYFKPDARPNFCRVWQAAAAAALIITSRALTRWRSAQGAAAVKRTTAKVSVLMWFGLFFHLETIKLNFCGGSEESSAFCARCRPFTGIQFDSVACAITTIVNFSLAQRERYATPRTPNPRLMIFLTNRFQFHFTTAAPNPHAFMRCSPHPPQKQQRVRARRSSNRFSILLALIIPSSSRHLHSHLQICPASASLIPSPHEAPRRAGQPLEVGLPGVRAQLARWRRRPSTSPQQTRRR